MIGVELAPDEPIETLVEYATTAERAGFDAVFVSHHYNNRDQFAALTAIAAATADLLVGPAVVNPYETHPVTLAARMATLDEYSGGRGVFGIGAGDRSTLANLGLDRDRPLGRVLETVQVARRLWRGERVTHEGTFDASAAGLNFQPPAGGDLPVYVGAQGPDMTRMAAKHADGVLFNGAHPRDIEWASERVSEGLDARSAETDEDAAFDFAAYASVSVAESGERARAAARVPVAFVVGGAPDPVLARHGIDPDAAAAVGEAVEAGEFASAAERVTDAMVEAFCIAGTPAEVTERVEVIRTMADSIVAAAPIGPDVERAIESAGDALTSRR